MGEPSSLREIMDEFGDRIRAEFEARLEKMRREHEAEMAELRGEAEARRDVLNIPAAARVLGVSAKTIQRRLAEGRIPHFRVGGDKGVRIERTELLKAARARFPKLHPGRSRLRSGKHFPGSVTTPIGKIEKLPSASECS